MPNAYASKICAGKIKDPSGVKRKDYATRVKAANGGKLKMVTNKEGKKVPFFAADGKGAKDLGKAKMMKGGRVKKMGGGMSKLNPGLRKFMMAKKKAK